MINTATLTKFSGPPGTGKSTTLLNVVASLLEAQVDPEHIVYTTFTRAGAYEARDRACDRFKLSANRLPYFRTLHSLCFGLLPQADVMQAADWCIIARTLGLFFSVRLNPDEGVPRGHTKGDYLLSLWSLARVTMQEPRAVWAQRETAISGGAEYLEAEFLQFIETVDNYKKEFGKIDYTDMLYNWLHHGQDIHCDYVIIDEAQDLSALQWAVVNKLCAHAKQVWVAGDDDQCIHEWNGAAPKHFIDLAAQTYTVLPQSYRIPAKVHTLAESIITQVKNRLPKVYQPRTDLGRVERVAAMEQVDLSKGSWLLLARNQCYLDEFASLCRRQGILFSGTGFSAIDQKVIDAIRAWRELSLGAITAARAKGMYGYMSQRDRVVRGYKVRLQAERDDRMVTYDELVKDFGLTAAKTMPWMNALDMIPSQEGAYLRAVELKEGLDQPVRIRVSTIHGAKGQEADHVLLRPDMTQKTYESWLAAPEPEHRVFYVAVTRARESLHLLPAQTERAYPI